VTSLVIGRLPSTSVTSGGHFAAAAQLSPAPRVPLGRSIDPEPARGMTGVLSSTCWKA
jgi:hypothetical protein